MDILFIFCIVLLVNFVNTNPESKLIVLLFKYIGSCTQLIKLKRKKDRTYCMHNASGRKEYMLMQLEGNTRKKLLEIAYFKDLLGTYLLLMDLLETIWE